MAEDLGFSLELNVGLEDEEGITLGLAKLGVVVGIGVGIGVRVGIGVIVGIDVRVVVGEGDNIGEGTGAFNNISPEYPDKVKANIFVLFRSQKLSAR